MNSTPIIKTDFTSIRVGTALPTLVTKPISRTTLALYAGASGDHNPIHIDLDFAKAAGLPDVIAHGMLPMAYLGRLLTNWVPQKNLVSYGVRFTAMTNLLDQISCEGVVTDIFEDKGQKRAKAQIQAKNQTEDIKLVGEAIFVF